MFYAWCIPVLAMFVVYGAFIARHAVKIRRTTDPVVLEFKDNSTFFNEVLLAGLFFASGVLWPFIYEPTGASDQGIELLYVASTLIIVAISANWYAQGTFNYFRCRRNPAEKRRRLDEEAAMLNKYREKYEYDLGVDVKRKILHLLPGLVIIVIELSSFIVENYTTLYADTGITRKAFAVFGETTIAYIFVFMIGYADYLRVTDYTQLPNWAKRWFFSSLKRSEMRTFVSSCALVLTLTPFLFAPIQVFVSVAFVSSLADAAANLIGRKFGKRKFPKGSQKTEAGYVAGTVSAFCVVLVFSQMFNYTAMPLLQIFYIACAAAVIFFMIDAFSKNVSDNILNPLLTGAAMIAVVFFL
ncbi:MAG: phosphatidate cytidylyltransferase [Candidatus Sigynarchaeota archaeon]